jgi:hypothetical protein
MDGIVGDRILRCSDGHLFTSTEGARLFLSVHLGAKRFMRCPVDRKWRICENVQAAGLDDAEREGASHYRH